MKESPARIAATIAGVFIRLQFAAFAFSAFALVTAALEKTGVLKR